MSHAPRHPTREQLEENLRLCHHQVEVLRAHLLAKRALIKELRARIRELEAGR